MAAARLALQGLSVGDAAGRDVRLGDRRLMSAQADGEPAIRIEGPRRIKRARDDAPSPARVCPDVTSGGRPLRGALSVARSRHRISSPAV
jgi:hypothetical protein